MSSDFLEKERNFLEKWCRAAKKYKRNRMETKQVLPLTFVRRVSIVVKEKILPKARATERKCRAADSAKNTSARRAAGQDGA